MNSNSTSTAGASALGSMFSWFGGKSKPQPVAVVAEEAPAIRIVMPDAPRILVVDDDDVIRKATEIKLRAQGYIVSTAADGPSAIQTARLERPDLILLDLNFPPDVSLTWDGFGIMAWLRRMEGFKQTPIIICTGSDGADLAQRAQADGAAGFFHKPLDYDALLGLVRSHLKASQRAQADSADGSFEI